MPAPFPIDPVQTGIAIAYRNRSLIADGVLPRVPVGKAEFKYLLHAMAEGFTIPDTRVGRKSEPNQVSFSATEQTSSTENYGLDDIIPNEDIANAPENYDPLSHSTEQLTNLVLLDREVRTAGLVFDSSQYTHKTTKTGTGQWSDYDGSDPLSDLMTGLDTPVMRPNVIVMGQAVFTKLAMHPKLVKAYNGTSGDSGIVPREFIAQLLEVEELLVGQSFVNTAKKGQAASISRVWGKHVSMFYRDQLASMRNGTTFGMTAQFGDRVSGQIDEPKIGLDGSIRNRVGEKVKELIAAPDLGYFIENAVA